MLFTDKFMVELWMKHRLLNYAWYSVNSEGKLHDVSRKKPNGYGLYDFVEMLAEWCWGVQVAYSGEDVTDPVTQPGDGYISFRGGSYESSKTMCNTAWWSCSSRSRSRKCF